MSRFTDASPDPKSHIKTLMRIGYTMSSAVSDILDNSITANAKNINIHSLPGLEELNLSIVDDGEGMSPNELIHNMKIGCKDPSDERLRGDLGRFGSGLKTASFSQARKLTVISKKTGEPMCAAVWDIDRIENENTWCLEILEEDEVRSHPFLLLDNKIEQGTQVIWEKLACLNKTSHSLDNETVMSANLSELSDYISLHFHKFMEGKSKRSFLINGRKLEAIDPFMSRSQGYQEGRSEKLRCKGGYIEINTHVLPHFNRMEAKPLERLGGANGIVQNQGLYIYREGRLINAGGWLGLAKTSQLGALARVEVNVPSSLDQDWSTDVKKASLQLPPRIKKELRKFLSDPIQRSKRVYRYRGKQDEANKYWNIQENENDKTISYQISAENDPLNEIFRAISKEQKSKLIKYLGQLAENLPLNHIYQKMSESPKDIDQENTTDALLEAIMNRVFEAELNE
ncbi:MAG: ATP-binding protein [Paraglaciecola sp.]|uniref:ATP-binding protein n=1 Tax=Paraglaciecola sp. TaxID=1920173 RepID=UPI00329807C5